MANIQNVASEAEENGRRAVDSIFPSVKRKTDKILSLAYDMDLFDKERNRLLLEKTEYSIVKESMLLSNMIRSAVTDKGDKSVIESVCNDLVRAEVVEEGAVVHIVFNTLLPKRMKNGTLRDLDVEYLTYAAALNKAFKQHEIARYSEKVFLCFRHIYTSEREMLDHDNIEIKTVLDAITLNVLHDDGPKQCGLNIDYEMGEYKHTEIDIVPVKEFPSYILAKQKKDLSQ